MHQITVHHDFDAPATLVWELLADFANIRRWWPRDEPDVHIERIELEGQGIGLIRHIYNRGFAAPISERLDLLDPHNRRLQLSIVGQRPAGLTAYQATGQVLELGAGRCRLDYRSQFTTATGRPEQATAFLHLAYALMFKGLSQAVGREHTVAEGAQ